MLKKYIVLGMLSLACSAAYADGHSTLDVADNVKNQSFHINDINFTYQFNNNADEKSKPMQFSVNVDSSSQYGVHVQCFHKMEAEKRPRNLDRPGNSFTQERLKFLMKV